MKPTATKVIAVSLSAILAAGGLGSLLNSRAAGDEGIRPVVTAPLAVTAGTTSVPFKDETVYILTGADGAVEKIIVSDWLRNPYGSAKLQDRTTLLDVENVKGEETFTASGGKLAVNIYGHETHSAGRSLEFETVYEATIPKPEEIVTEDPELPEGEREVTSSGRTGCKVSVYKKVFENGKQVSRDWFSSSSYRAVADEVRVGTKAAEPAVNVPEESGYPSWLEEYPSDFYEGYEQNDAGEYHEF